MKMKKIEIVLDQNLRLHIVEIHEETEASKSHATAPFINLQILPFQELLT
jgi:hypothetical protein